MAKWVPPPAISNSATICPTTASSVCSRISAQKKSRTWKWFRQSSISSPATFRNVRSKNQALTPTSLTIPQASIPKPPLASPFPQAHSRSRATSLPTFTKTLPPSKKRASLTTISSALPMTLTLRTSSASSAPVRSCITNASATASESHRIKQATNATSTSTIPHSIAPKTTFAKTNKNGRHFHCAYRFSFDHFEIQKSNQQFPFPVSFSTFTTDVIFFLHGFHQSFYSSK